MDNGTYNIYQVSTYRMEVTSDVSHYSVKIKVVSMKCENIRMSKGLQGKK